MLPQRESSRILPLTGYNLCLTVKQRMEIKETDLEFRSFPEDRYSTNRIVVHHTAGPVNQSVLDIHRYHRSKGWLGVGYNLLQDKEGAWHEGRGIDKQGAHAFGYNSNSVGICLIGNFEEDALSSDRWESLVQMCSFLCLQYGLEYTDIVGHRELPGASTLCPGKHIDLSALRRAVLRQPIPDNDSASIYRVVVDGIQVGAFTYPLRAIGIALSKNPEKVLIEKV